MLTNPPNNTEHWLYETRNGDTKLEVLHDDKTVWLTQLQLAALYKVDRSVITKHIRNIYSDGELSRTATSTKFPQTRQEGTRTVKRNIEYYSLDMIIAVGYRVNSGRGKDFRIWATQMLQHHTMNSGE